MKLLADYRKNNLCVKLNTHIRKTIFNHNKIQSKSNRKIPLKFSQWIYHYYNNSMSLMNAHRTLLTSRLGKIICTSRPTFEYEQLTELLIGKKKSQSRSCKDSIYFNKYLTEDLECKKHSLRENAPYCWIDSFHCLPHTVYHNMG